MSRIKPINKYRQLSKEQEQVMKDNLISLVLKNGCWFCDGDVEILKVSKGVYKAVCSKCFAGTSNGSAKQVEQWAKELKRHYDFNRGIV